MIRANQNAQQREASVMRKLEAEGLKQRTAEVLGVDVAARTVEVAFSSEAEVPRWFGIEVLSHDAEAVDMSRMNDGAAVLEFHNWEKQRGVVDSARIDSDRVGRAVVRLSRSPAGEELLQDIADGIKRHVSVGYFIKAIKLTEEREDVDVYTVTRWQPYEISFVPIPADVTVGVGRSADIPAMGTPEAEPETFTVPPSRDASQNEEPQTNMKDKITRDASGNLVRAKVDEDGRIVEVLEVIERAGDAANSARAAGANAERDRVRSINAMAERFGKSVDDIESLARTALSEGHSPETFQGAILDAMDKRAAKPLNEQLAGADIGLSDKEVRSYSMLKVVRALMDPTDKKAQREAAFEFEASEAAREKQDKQSERFVIPTDVLRRSVYGEIGSGIRAPLNSGTSGGASSGGNVIATNLMSASFIDILRAKATIMRRARVLGGLVGNIDIPKQLAGAVGYWIGEDDDAGETGIELGQIPMSPKTVAAFSEITRKLLNQSSLDVEAMVRADLAVAMALTIDKAGYYGSGTANQPLGLANHVGINAVEFVGTFPTYAELVAMETAIALDNADTEALAYTANAGFRGNAKTTLKFQNVAGTIWEQGGSVNGYGAEITNQVAAGDVFMGDWGNFVVGMWGGLEMNVDPFSNSKKGRLRIITFQDVDFAVRRNESFCLGRKKAA